MDVFWRDLEGTWSGSRGATGQARLRADLRSYSDIEGRLQEEYEEAKDTTSLFKILEELTPLARAARNMYVAIQSARDAIGPDSFIIEIRDQASDTERNFEILLEDVRNALQYRTAREAEISSKLQMEALHASRRLNTFAALFFPLTAVGTIFGMNFVLGIENNPGMFWVALGTGIAAGVGTALWVVGKREK